MKNTRLNLLFAAVVACMMLTSCSNNQESNNETAPTNVVNFDEAEVRELLIATQEAPSWANQQPSKYYVAMSPEKVEAVANLVGERNKQNIAGAPVLIVSTYEKGKSGFFRGEQTNEVGDGWGAYDNGLSNAYFILKARAKGFDTLIMGMRDSDALRTLFNIPENEAIMAVISLGYRSGKPRQPEHRPLAEVVQFF